MRNNNTRDTVNPVYNALAELVGLYVEEQIKAPKQFPKNL